MTFHFARDGSSLGTFAVDQIPAAVATGKLRVSDLCWIEGMTDWEPLSKVAAERGLVITPVAQPPAAPPAMHGGLPPVVPIAPSQLHSGYAGVPAPMVPTNSGMAIASMVLGIFGFFCAGIPAIIGLILGIVALGQIKRSNGMLTGRGMAITGIVLGSLMIALFVVVLLAGLTLPVYGGVQDKARQAQAMNNARQITIMLKSYASDNNGSYPDSDRTVPLSNSNDTFRKLFTSGLMQDETVFTVKDSYFSHADNLLGEPPGFDQALEANENAWALSVGLTDTSSGTAPLIFECPVDGTFPPVWDMDNAGKPVVGRGWKGGKIIVGRNDGSVSTELLDGTSGHVPLQSTSTGETIMNQVPSGKFLMPLIK